jgi:hypothetical protein
MREIIWSNWNASSGAGGETDCGLTNRANLALPFERRGNSPCLILLVKAIRVRACKSLANSLVARDPDHFFRHSFPRVMLAGDDFNG